jgi:hypothetical protein
MAQKLIKLVFGLLVGVSALSGNFNGVGVLDGANVDSMENVFMRSDKLHQDSISEISKTLTLEKAVDVLRNSSVSNPALTRVTDMLLKSQGKDHHFRKQPEGYSGVEGAKKMLNDMIFESMSKYDAEIAKCTQYYSEQCAAMEVCRGQIAAANYIAANRVL